ncbi:hypothetical protein MCEMIH15_01218 [Caulobacteraceae bacterium]
MWFVGQETLYNQYFSKIVSMRVTPRLPNDGGSTTDSRLVKIYPESLDVRAFRLFNRD